jgi:hypothetical protein
VPNILELLGLLLGRLSFIGRSLKKFGREGFGLIPIEEDLIELGHVC